MALQSAVDLSPDYNEAIYDLAQYSAQIRDMETCISSLRKAIETDSFYYYLAKEERNFEPLLSDVQSLLNSFSRNAYDEASKEVQKAREMIETAETSMAEAKDAILAFLYKPLLTGIVGGILGLCGVSCYKSLARDGKISGGDIVEIVSSGIILGLIIGFIMCLSDLNKIDDIE